jgi:hypothetical protein
MQLQKFDFQAEVERLADALVRAAKKEKRVSTNRSLFVSLRVDAFYYCRALARKLLQRALKLSSDVDTLHRTSSGHRKEQPVPTFFARNGHWNRRCSNLR